MPAHFKHIRNCQKGAAWEKALCFLFGMSQSDIELDVINCNAAIRACEKSGKWEKALLIFNAIGQCLVEYSAVTAINIMNAYKDKRSLKWGNLKGGTAF